MTRPKSKALVAKDTASTRDLVKAKPARRVASLPPPQPRPLISDEEDFIIESFAIGYSACPREFREDFYESWVRSHRKAARLLVTALFAIETFEKFEAARRGQLAAGRN